MTALGLFSRLWFPSWPLWSFTVFYTVLGLLVILLGSRGINKAENLFAMIKIAAVLTFIGVAVAALVRGRETGLRFTAWKHG